MTCHWHPDRFFDWCPYCPKGEERRRRFFAEAMKVIRRRLR